MIFPKLFFISIRLYALVIPVLVLVHSAGKVNNKRGNQVVKYKVDAHDEFATKTWRPKCASSAGAISSIGNISVVLTFDDGPHPKNTPLLLDLLKIYNAKVTFFLIGRKAGYFPNITRRIIDEGHEIGCHGWSHRKFDTMPGLKIRQEIEACISSIRNITGGFTPTLIRPPKAITTPELNDFFAATFNMTTVLFSLGPEDWKRPPPDIIVRNILSFYNPGDVIVCHDNNDNTIEAMPRVLQGFHHRGLTLATVSQALAQASHQSFSKGAPQIR